MPNRNYPRYSGGSGLADLLSGLADGYKTGAALKSQRDADKLARDREARYVAEEAAKRKQQELQNERDRLADAAQGRYASTEGLDLDEQVTTRDNSDARSVLGATRALGALPGMDVSGLSSLIKDTTEKRYQQSGAGALDRVRTDPALQTRLKDEATRQTGLQQRVEDDRASKALEQIAPGAGAARRAGASADTSLRYADGVAQRIEQEKERAETLASLQEQFRRLGGKPEGLTAESLAEEIKGLKDIKNYASKRSIDRQYEQPSYSIQRDAAGNAFAINTRDPKDVRAIPQIGGSPTAPGGASPTLGNYLKSTEAERKSAGWLVRSTQGALYLQGNQIPDNTSLMLAQSADRGGSGVLANTKRWGLTAAAGKDAQQYTQAQRQFAQAILRKDTGAQINDDEMQWVAQTWFPQPGESKENRALKFKAQDDAILELAITAGKAIGVPEAAGARRVLAEIQNPRTYAVRRAQQLRTAGFTDEAELRKQLAADVAERFPNGGQ